MRKVAKRVQTNFKNTNFKLFSQLNILIQHPTTMREH